MNGRWLWLCGGLLLIASVASGAGPYQRARDGRTLVWNDSSKTGEEAEWSGKRDKNGFATGSGTLTWYKVAPTIVTGSNIRDARRHAVVISRYSGQMVQGKFEGAVTYVGPNGKNSSATSVEVPTQVDESLRSLTAPPPKSRESVAVASPQASAPSTPPPLPWPTSAAAGNDGRTVAALDNQYQAAVRNNDPATMDRILADDFVLVTGRGNALSKADLIKEAREKRTIYEHQEEEEGTQKVRIWGDTAVVTALLR